MNHHMQYSRAGADDGTILQGYSLDIINPAPAADAKPKRVQTKEFSWMDRANIIFFHLHPELAGGNSSITESTFGINKSTLAGWLTNKISINKWYSFVESLNVQQVMRSVSKEKKYLFAAAHPASKVNLAKFAHARDLPSAQEDDDAQFVKKISNKRKRIGDNLGRPRTYTEQRDWIITTVQQRWESGDPITKSDLLICMKERWSRDKDFFNALLDPSGKNYPDSVHKFINRTLQRASFTNRKKAICEIVPSNWRQIAEENSLRICKRMQNEGVEALVCMDEILFRFFESSSGVYPLALNFADRMSCTVLVATDLISDRFLPSFVVYGGYHAQNVMRRWQPYQNSAVYFSDMHWQTSAVTIDFLRFLRTQFPGKKIGVIMDSISSHTSPNVAEWIAESNELHEEKLILELIEQGVSTVYLPSTVCINKLVKEAIYSKFSVLRPQNLEGKNVEPIAASCEQLTAIIEDSLRALSESAKKTKVILKAFRLCGLDPNDIDRLQAERHLNSLSVNSLYDHLLSNQLFGELH